MLAHEQKIPRVLLKSLHKGRLTKSLFYELA